MAPEFNEKDLNDRSIGDILRESRLSRNETLEDVERSTRIFKKYLAALETDDFKRLPDPVYAKNFVKALSAHYGLDGRSMVESLLREMSAATGKPPEMGLARAVAGGRLAVTPNVVKTAIFVLCFIAIAGYFAYSVQKILQPPDIRIASPQDNQVYHDQHVVLEGKTEPEVELTVNRESVLIESDGSFKDTLNLPAGVSILRVAAKKKHSKEREVYIKVVVVPPQNVASATGTVATP